MSFKIRGVYAPTGAMVGVASSLLSFLPAPDAGAAIIRTSKHASTSNHTVATTTSGQRSIIMTVDPLDVASFNLDVLYETEKVEFVDIKGLNGYVIDGFDNVTEGTFGGVFDIHGYFPGFNDAALGANAAAAAAAPAGPPQGEVNIFELTFLDLAPAEDKTFTVQAGLFGYIRSYNDTDGTFDIANGPYDPATGIGVDPAISTAAGISAAPLPSGLVAGAIGAVAALAAARRKRLS